jgi:predicted transcriptional regulator
MVKRLPRGELEAQIMDVLWDALAALTPHEVQAAVSSPRRPLAYNTITTVLVRLWDKGMLERTAVGRGFAYQPIASREEWAAQRMREVLDASGDPESALQHFVESITVREASELRKVLDARKRRR